MGNIKSKRDPSTLSDAEIQLLLHKTDLSRDDILEWHKEFIVRLKHIFNDLMILEYINI